MHELMNIMRKQFDRATKTTSLQHDAIHFRRLKMVNAVDDRFQWACVHRQPLEAATIWKRIQNHRLD